MIPATIALTDPTEIVVEIAAEEESTPIRGNAMASGDENVDRETEDEIIRQLEGGNEWAWCTARVAVSAFGASGVAFLGCCSYANERDFKHPMGYLPQMIKEAFEDLVKVLEASPRKCKVTYNLACVDALIERECFPKPSQIRRAEDAQYERDNPDVHCHAPLSDGSRCERNAGHFGRCEITSSSDEC